MIRKIAVCVVSLLMLAGCDFNGKVDARVILPKVPAQYRACAAPILLPKGQLSRTDVVKLVADLRKSELAKSACIRGLIAWYDNVVASYGK